MSTRSNAELISDMLVAHSQQIGFHEALLEIDQRLTELTERLEQIVAQLPNKGNP